MAEAAAELKRIDATHQESLEVLTIRVAILHEQKKWPELAQIAAKLVTRAPSDAAAWVTWAYAVRRCDSLESAERILLNAEQQHPAEPTIQFNLGCYACLRGDIREAKRRVDRAIALEPRFMDALATDPDLAALRAVSGKREHRQAE